MQIAGADNEYGSFPKSNDRFWKVLADSLGKAALKCFIGFLGEKISFERFHRIPWRRKSLFFKFQQNLWRNFLFWKSSADSLEKAGSGPLSDPGTDLIPEMQSWPFVSYLGLSNLSIYQIFQLIWLKSKKLSPPGSSRWSSGWCCCRRRRPGRCRQTFLWQPLVIVAVEEKTI